MPDGHSPQSDLAILEQLNRDYIASVQNSDVARFDQLLAPEFYCSNPDGAAKSGRYTDVWARQSGSWLAVSAHVTRG